MIDQTYYLPMVPGGIPVRVPVSQYDAGAGRNIIFTLIGPNSQAFEVPDGADVTCDGTKKDKKAFSYVVTADGSTVTVPVEQQMTAAAGPAVCQITISNDGAVLGTANFVLDVERAALADDADMSETEIASLQTWLAAAIVARDAAEASEMAAADSATDAAASAEESAASATESATSAKAAAESATAAAEAASTAASEAAEATAEEIKESIQDELDKKADQTDLDDAVKDIATNASNISSLQSSVSELNSKPPVSGTSYSEYINTAGYLTGSKKQISFSIPFPVQGKTISTVIRYLTVRQSGSYLYGDGNEQTAPPDDATITASAYLGYINVVIVFADALDGTNNEPVGIACSLTVTIS